MAAGRTRARTLRVVWLGVGVGVAWGAASIIGSATAASADDGLVGLVGDTVSQVTDRASETTDALDAVVGRVVDTVAARADTAPRPVRDTLDTVRDVVPAAERTVDHVAAPVVNGALGVVAEVGGSSPVGAVVDPIVGIVTELPLVGAVVTETGLDGTVDGVVDTVDGTIGEVVGSTDAPTPGSPTVPGVPGSPGGPTAPGPGAAPDVVAPTPSGAAQHPLQALADTATSTAAAETSTPASAAVRTPWSSTSGDALTTSAATDVGAPPGHSPGWPGPASGSPPGGAPAPGGQSASTPVGAVSEPTPLTLPRGGVTPPNADDDLPGSPVFDTDTSPD